ncbi:MAG TPA: hypothetical protein VFX51_12450 [Solirubrobacteraceae bacterium]|nr:hypothetical protein [Solirubrobacteraceae bacterium]
MARKLLLLGAAVVAAGIFLKRDKVAGLLPSRTEPYEPPAPGPSNYDAPGPVANTATPVPVPEPHQPAAIDEAAEEAAAAAEAANIGGTVSDYVGPTGERADEAERPLAEAGEGEAEGLEQAEFQLEQEAQPAEGMSPAEHQIEDTIEQADNPFAGEVVEPVQPAEEPTTADQEDTEATGWAPPTAEPEPTPADDEPAPFDERAADQPTVEADAVPEPDDTPAATEQPAAEPEKDEGGEGTDWRTWSGRSINP